MIIRNRYLVTRNIDRDAVLQFLTLRTSGYVWPQMTRDGRHAACLEYGPRLAAIRGLIATLVMESELPDDMFDQSGMKCLTEGDVKFLRSMVDPKAEGPQGVKWTLEDALLTHLFGGVVRDNNWVEFHTILCRELFGWNC